MPQYRKCTEEDVYRILLEAEARGESLTREGLAKRVAEKCGYKIGTARNLAKSSERIGLIKCSGWGRESLCKPVKEHYVNVALDLDLILITWPNLREEDLRETTLTHIVSRDRNSLAIAKGVVRWWRKFEELRQQIYSHITFLVQSMEEEGEVIEDELRRLKWEVGLWRLIGSQRIPDALDRLYDMVLKGELTSSRLNELEGVAPKTVRVVRVAIIMAKQLLLMRRALLKLQEKVDKLREVLPVMLRHYVKKMRIQGFCSYCAKDVSKEIKNLVENLRKAIYIAQKAEIYNQLISYLESAPFNSLSSRVLREYISSKFKP